MDIREQSALSPQVLVDIFDFGADGPALLGYTLPALRIISRLERKYKLTSAQLQWELCIQCSVNVEYVDDASRSRVALIAGSPRTVVPWALRLNPALSLNRREQVTLPL